ncbi:MAG: hypothetical protein ABMB14_01855, partial [Myxococcota bacterium]
MNQLELPVPKPCPARWDRMVGDNRTRFCRACRATVHDLTARTASEARALLRDHPGGCVRYSYDRHTGLVVHRDGDGCSRTRARSAGRRAWVLVVVGSLIGAPAWAGITLAPAAVDAVWDRLASWFGGRPAPARPELVEVTGLVEAPMTLY